jgi:predicted SnoaL-like aldol condensation-catalyzing enzyme
MSQSRESRNKALVLEAFDTLFNKRDYAAAERFWSPNYIQHSAHIEPAAKVCSTSSRLLRRPSNMSRA